MSSKEKRTGRRGMGWVIGGLSILVGIGLGAVAAVSFVPAELSGKVQNRLDAMLAEAPPPLPDMVEYDWVTLETGYHTIEQANLPIGNVDASATGGAIDLYGDFILRVSANGRIGYYSLTTGDLGYIADRVPMRYEEMRSEHFAQLSTFNQNFYRVTDILVRDDMLYVSHHIYDPETTDMCMLVSRRGLTLADGAIQMVGDWEEIYRVRDCIRLEDYDFVFHGHMSGGRMITDGPDHILMTVGSFALGNFEGEWDRVQPDAPTDYSKILRIDTEARSAEIYAAGFRNPQGLARDRLGRIWESEHGAQSGDEVNLIRQGGDYGWPNVSVGFDYGGPRKAFDLNPVQGQHEGYIQPVFAFVPAVATSQILTRPEGVTAFELWFDDVLVTTLKDMAIHRLRLDGDRVVYDERIEIGARVRDGIWLPDGRIVLLTGDHQLIFLRDPLDAEPQPIRVAGYDAVAPVVADAARMYEDFPWGKMLFTSKCGICHQIDGTIKAGPPLNGIGDAPIGKAADYAYTQELASASGNWSRAKLKAFILDPERDYPGSAMPGFDGIDPYELEAILDYLEEI